MSGPGFQGAEFFVFAAVLMFISGFAARDADLAIEIDHFSAWASVICGAIGVALGFWPYL